MGIREVAKMASVSTATVSRLITGSARVSPKTATRVLRAMAAVAFQPNEAARILAILKKLKRSNGASSVPSEEGLHRFAHQTLRKLFDTVTDCLHRWSSCPACGRPCA